jgi:hypothetical protein
MRILVTIALILVVGCSPAPSLAPESAANQTDKVASRSNPVPVGVALPLKNGDREFAIAITKVYRGREAYSQIEASYSGVKPPLDKMEYVLAYVEVNYLKGPADKALALTDGDFDMVSNGQVASEVSLTQAIPPKPWLDALRVFPGAKAGGWFVKQVFIGDLKPLLAFGMGLATDSSSGFYFAVN